MATVKNFVISSSNIHKHTSSKIDPIIKTYIYNVTPWFQYKPSTQMLNTDNYWGEGNKILTEPDNQQPYVYFYLIRAGVVTVQDFNSELLLRERAVNSFNEQHEAIEKIVANDGLNSIIASDSYRFMFKYPIGGTYPSPNPDKIDDLPSPYFGDTVVLNKTANSKTIYNLSTPVRTRTYQGSGYRDNFNQIGMGSSLIAATIDDINGVQTITAEFNIPNTDELASGTSTLGRSCIYFPYTDNDSSTDGTNGRFIELMIGAMVL